MRIQLGAWLAVLWVPMLCCGFGGWGDSSDRNRVLDPLITEHGSLQVRARLSVANPLAVQCTGNYNGRVSVHYELGGAGPNPIEVLRLQGDDDLFAFSGRDEAAVQVRFLRADIEQCRRGIDTVFSVHDPEVAQRVWMIAYAVPDGSVAISELERSESDCQSVANTAPTLLESVERGLERPTNGNDCQIYARLGNRRRAISCLLEHGSTQVAFLTEVEAGIRVDSSEFLSILRSGDVADSSIKLAVGRRLMLAVPESERRHFLQERIAYCQNPLDACGPHHIDLLATGAAELEPTTACEAIVELGVRYLEGDGVVTDRRALAALRPTMECGADTRRRGLMRSALMHSNEEPGGLHQDRCRGDRAISSPYCTSLTRFAGEWLAGHCDAQTVALAGDFMTAERVDAFLARTPVGYSATFDGSLRILARCDPERWNELFGAYRYRDGLGAHHQPAQ